MEWIKDLTGRFLLRPFYSNEELDEACEQIVSDFLLKKYGKISYPISTEDITIMIERDVKDLDLYADFSDEKDIEGKTVFVPGERPRMYIANILSENPRLENRKRTTLTHEYTHVKFQGHLYHPENASNRVGNEVNGRSALCKQSTILKAARTDWMEWQAGYGCGAMLMPKGALTSFVQSFLLSKKIIGGTVAINSSKGEELIAQMMEMFTVSYQAAKVRLTELGILVRNKNQRIRDEENAILVKRQCLHKGCPPGRCNKAVTINGFAIE